MTIQMKAIELDVFLAFFSILYKVALANFSRVCVWNPIKSETIQMKATGQYVFPVLFSVLYKVALANFSQVCGWNP